MSGASAVGRIVGVVTPLVLMAWAVTEVDSFALRTALLGWMVLSVMIQVAVAGGWQPPRQNEQLRVMRVSPGHSIVSDDKFSLIGCSCGYVPNDIKDGYSKALSAHLATAQNRAVGK